MTQRVKVGADEWLVADASKTTLMTDGLSGCVAIGFAVGDKIAMAHVFSECSKKNDNWRAYETALTEALESSGLTIPKGTPAHLVYSDASDEWLATNVGEWLKSKDFAVKPCLASGCAIGIDATAGTIELQPKLDKNAAQFLNGYKTSADADAEVARSTLSKKARSAQQATTFDREEYKAPAREREPRLYEPEHPANGIFNQIIAKIPKELVDCEEDADKPFAEGARQLASALTVEYLKYGDNARIDKIAEGVGPGKDKLFLATDPPLASAHAMAVPLDRADNETYPTLQRESATQAYKLCEQQAAQQERAAEQQRTQRTAASLN